MLFSMAQVQTPEPIDKVLDLMQESCDKVNVKIKSVDKSNYQITGKSYIRKRSVIGVVFFIVLKQNNDGTKIEIYDGYPGVFGPDKRLVEPLLKSLATKIPFTTAYTVNKVNRGITRDGLVNTIEENISSPPEINTTNFKITEYDVDVIGEYDNKDIGKIKTMSISLEGIHELHLKKNEKSSPLFKIPFKNIDDVKIVAINKGFIKKNNDLVLSISFTVNGNSSSNVSPISVNNNI